MSEQIFQFTKDNEKFLVFQADEEDTDDLVDFVMEYWAPEKGYSTGDSDEDYKGVREHFKVSIKHGVVIFIKKGKNVVGMIGGFTKNFFWENTKAIHEDWFYVKEGYRSKGIGIALIRCLQGWAKSHSYDHIYIHPNMFGGKNIEKVKDLLLGLGFVIHGYSLVKEL